MSVNKGLVMGFFRFLTFAMVYAAICLTLLLPFFAYYRYLPLYRLIKKPHMGWSAPVHVPDPLLGYSPLPGAVTKRTVKQGASVPVRFSNQGFRIPVSENLVHSPKPPVVLALGCSFTFGDMCLAENSYPYLVAEGLGGSEINAGVCGYGLAQMFALANELIPSYRPDIIIIQYSPWLVDRAISQFFSTYYGRVATPYFIQSGNTFKVEPPVFSSVLWKVPIANFHSTPVNILDRISFTYHVALPLFLNDDIQYVLSRIRNLDQSRSSLVSDPAWLVYSFFQVIDRIARENGSKVVILSVGNEKRFELTTLLNDFPDLAIAHGERALIAATGGDKNKYNKSYFHWYAGKIIDRHPNPSAHRILADTVLATIESRGWHAKNEHLSNIK